MSDTSRTAGPYIRWLDYGTEGWKPDSFPTLDAAVRAENYGNTFVVTKIVNYRVVEVGTHHPPSQQKPRGRPAEFVDHVAAILRDATKPMQRAEIVAALADRGMEIPSFDKDRYLGTILWRQRHLIENIRGEGYQLIGITLPSRPKGDATSG